jgi:glycosyltransferase involved in cell wall biosynthesis
MGGFMSFIPRILMIAPSCYPPGNPEAFVNANLVSAMLRAGWSVDVVTGADPASLWYPESGSMWSDVAAWSHMIEERPRTFSAKVLSNAEYGFLSGQVMGGGRWAVPAAQRALQLTCSKTYDVILSRALPATAHLAAFIVAGKTGIPWIANWNDPVPDYLFPPPYARGNGARIRMGFWESRYYRALLRRAAWHTFPCERLRNYISGYLSHDIAIRSSVIPHVAPEPIERIRAQKPIFNLLYAGSLRKPRDPRPFLIGIRKFLNTTAAADIEVSFITDRPEDVIDGVREHSLERIVRIDPGRPYEEMPQVLLQADVLVIIEADMKEGIFIPSKFVDYVQTGRPILAISPRTGTLADILTNHGGGLAADCARPDSVASGIADLYRSWQAGQLDEKYGSERLNRMFSREVILEKYLHLFNGLGLLSSPGNGKGPGTGSPAFPHNRSSE